MQASRSMPVSGNHTADNAMWQLSVAHDQKWRQNRRHQLATNKSGRTCASDNQPETRSSFSYSSRKYHENTLTTRSRCENRN